jgi:hypothetical protein
MAITSSVPYSADSTPEVSGRIRDGGRVSRLPSSRAMPFCTITASTKNRKMHAMARHAHRARANTTEAGLLRRPPASGRCAVTVAAAIGRPAISRPA